MLLSGGRTQHLFIITAIAAFVACLGAANPARGEFCESQLIHDYAKPLRGLRPLPATPLDEHLDFAPARVYLGHSQSGLLQVGPGQRGFVLAFSPWSDDNPASRRVGWQVTARLVKINQHGRPLAAPRTIERHVKRVPAKKGVPFEFAVSGELALYRLEIVFENGKGERLARFGEYFRVLRPSLDVDFFLNGTSFHRGELVQAYLVNRGVAYLSFGLDRTIQFYDGSSWTDPPGDWGGGVVPAIALRIAPGIKTSCWSKTIPTDAGLGTYRFVKTVDQSTGAPFSRETPLEVSAEFTVTG